jgi:integrase/recombinase XerD
MQASGLAPSTIKQTLGCARKAVRWAFKRGLVNRPCPTLDPEDRIKVEETEKVPFTDEQVREIIAYFDASEPHWLPIMLLLVDTGCRVGEACALHGADLDFAENVIFMRETKTGEPRSIAVPPTTMKLLPKVEAGERVFKPIRRAYRDRPMRPRVVLQAVRRAIKACGFHNGHLLDVHSFRRRFIATGVQEAPMSISMRQVGHRSTKVHMDYQRRSVGHDLHGFVGRVHWRRLSSTRSSRHSVGTSREARRPNSKKIPPESPSPASCWSATSGQQPLDQQEVEGRRPTTVGPPNDPLEPDSHPLRLAGNPHSEQLARLLELAPEVRSALIALATDSALRAGLLDAVADQWPNDLPDVTPEPTRREA